MTSRNCSTLLFGLVTVVGLQGMFAVEAAERTMENTIVYIECTQPQPNGQKVRGTGVVVSDDGLVLTAGHVVSPKNISPAPAPGGVPDCKGSTGVADTGVLQRLNVKAIPQLNVDVALLQFAAQKQYEFMPYCSLENWMVRSEIFVAGFPNGTETGAPSFREGILSTVRDNSAGILETDGQTVAGMSGGPVLSKNLGLLVGIVIGAKFDNVGMVSYFGILPVDRYAKALGLPQSAGPCYRQTHEVDLSKTVSQWKVGDGPVKLGVRADEGFCFIDKIWGQFNDPADSVGVQVVAGEYVLVGVNRSGGQHGASAKCIWYH